MRDILDQRNMKKPIWIGESNVIPHDDVKNALPAGQFRASLDQQAAYIIQAMAMAVAAGVERYAVYKATDEKAENATELWGLIRNDGSTKPAYVAYQVGTTYFASVKSAVFSWPGTDKPTMAQYRDIVSSNDYRTQFIWPSQVAQVSMERGDHRTTVVWNTSPEAVTHKVAANSKQATLVTKYGKTQTITAKDGFYSVDLDPSSHNADPRDPSIYMIGGDPLIIDEQVMPLPTDRLASRIEMVWPLNSASLEDTSAANVTAQFLTPGTNSSVACRYDPENVELWAWRHYEDPPRPTASPSPAAALVPTPSAILPTASTGATPQPSPEPVRGVDKREKDPLLLATGAKRFVTTDGLTYPVWDFNNVDVSYARTANHDRWLEMFVIVNGDIKMDSTFWTYGGDNNKNWQEPRPLPTESCR
jgi:hypothetical protein